MIYTKIFLFIISLLSKQNPKSPSKETTKSSSVRGRGRTPVKNSASDSTPFQPRSSLARIPPKVSKSSSTKSIEIQRNKILDSNNRNLLELSYTDLRFENESIPDSIDYNFEMSSKETSNAINFPSFDGALNSQIQNPTVSQNKRLPSSVIQSQHPTINPLLPTSANTGEQIDIKQIVDMLQSTIICTQEEFRRELTTIKGTIDQIYVNLNSPTTNSDHGNRLFESNQNQNLFSATGIPPIRFKEWKVVFDGTSSVSDFLFKLDTLCIRYKC